MNIILILVILFAIVAVALIGKASDDALEGMRIGMSDLSDRLSNLNNDVHGQYVKSLLRGRKIGNKYVYKEYNDLLKTYIKQLLSYCDREHFKEYDKQTKEFQRIMDEEEKKLNKND